MTVSGGYGIIYAIEPASGPAVPIGEHAKPGGELTWYRHVGWADGSFTWEGPKTVGKGWGQFAHVFAGEDGVVYAVQEDGDLLWYRHVGQDDGSFSWDGPKKVGTGWARFSTVFSGGDGIIYAVEPPSGPAVPIGEHAKPGGELTWYRHVGRTEGTSSWEGPKTVGKGWSDFLRVFHGQTMSLSRAADQITHYWSDSLAVLSVGSPSAPVARTEGGGFVQPHTFGSIIKPLGTPPIIADRFHVTVRLAGVRCWATDDPSGNDEPYIISAVYALDPREPEKAAQITRIGNPGIGEVDAGRVFAQNQDLAIDFAVPGDGDIRIHFELYDEETVSDPEKAKQLISKEVQDGIAAGVGALTVAYPPVGLIVGGVVVAAKAVGLLDDLTDAIGSVANIFADDRLGVLDLRVSNEFLVKLRDDPQSLDRKSDAIGGATYNFPQLPEDKSEAGKSWFFDEDGKGTYRPFFWIQKTEG
jgi:Tachylectin